MGIIQNSPQNKGLVKKKTRQWHCTLVASGGFDAGEHTTRIRESAPVCTYLLV
jgi:hypothetical protein